MGLWETLAAKQAQQQAQPPPVSSVAPGAWWQNQPQQQQRQQTVPGRQPMIPQRQYYQEPADEDCPRCGSDNYMALTSEAFGRPLTAELRGAKYCFDCRYPMRADATGTLVSSRGVAAMQGTDVKSLKVRQVVGGRTEAEIFANPVKID